VRVRKPGKATSNRDESSSLPWFPEPGVFQDSSLDLLLGLEIIELHMDEVPDVQWESPA